MQQKISLKVNGADRQLTIEPDTPLLYVLRNDLGLSSPRQGCNQEQCGACRVIMDGKAVYACTTTILEANNREVTTVEGLGVDFDSAENDARVISELILWLEDHKDADGRVTLRHRKIH